jgi:hypothetical protein
MPIESESKKLEVERKEKPSIVYHASNNPDIKEFIPRDERARDPSEGPVVFATPDRALASAFLVEDHNDDWMQIGFYNDILVIIICSDRNEFIKKDKGGTLYALPSDSFDFDTNRGMEEREWISHSNVKPVGKNDYPSTLDAMIENGAYVFFVDKKTFNGINKAKDYGANILLNCVSENQFREKDISKLKEVLKKETK